MYSELDELNLHDSELIDFRVIRVKEGEPDRIELYLDYIEDYDTVKTKRLRLVFTDCFQANLKLNFNMRPPDSILTGDEIRESDMLEEVKLKWKEMSHGHLGLNKRVDSLKHYRIEMNTTASVFDIIATGFVLAE